MPGRWWRLQEQPASPHSRGGGASLCLCLDPRPRWEASEATVRPENKQLFSSQSLGHRAFPEGEGLSGGQGDGAVRLHRSPQYWGGQDPAQAPASGESQTPGRGSLILCAGRRSRRGSVLYTRHRSRCGHAGGQFHGPTWARTWVWTAGGRVRATLLAQFYFFCLLPFAELTFMLLHLL